MAISTKTENLIQKWSIVLSAALLLLCFAIIFHERPWVDSDLQQGVFSLNNYLQGFGFHQNLYIGTDYAIHSELLSYWAPGEYVYSWFIARLLHIDISNGIILTNIIFLFSGLVAYYYLLKHFRFSNTIIAMSIFMLVFQRFFHGFLLKMNGVDVYLIVFAAFTVLLYEKYYASSRVSKQAQYLILLFIVMFSGLFSKNSFMLFIVSTSAYYFIANVLRLFKKEVADTTKPSVTKILMPGIIALIAAAIFYFLFYAQSRTPFSQRMNVHSLQLSPLKMSNIVIKPAIQTLGSPFTFDAFLLRIPTPEHSFFSYVFDFRWEGIIVSIILLIPFVLSIVNYYKESKKEVFPLLSIFFILGYFIFFAVAIIRQTDVYAEDRLFLPMILFVTPVYAHTLLYGSRFLRLCMLVFLFVSISFSLLAIPNIFKYYRKSAIVERSDFISGFMVYSETEKGDQLKTLGEVLKERFPSDNLLITKPNQFFFVQVNMPSVSVDLSSYYNFNSFVRANENYLSNHHINKVSVITSAGEPFIADTSIILEQVHLSDYSLYVLRAGKELPQ